MLAFFEALVGGDVATVRALMHAEFRFFSTGTLPNGGWHDGEELLGQGSLLAGRVAGPVTMRVGAVTAEDDRVVFEAEGDVPLIDGGRYANTYMMAFRVRDAKVVEFKEFPDTFHIYEVFHTPSMQGERRPRESPITEVTKTIHVG